MRSVSTHSTIDAATIAPSASRARQALRSGPDIFHILDEQRVEDRPPGLAVGAEPALDLAMAYGDRLRWFGRRNGLIRQALRLFEPNMARPSLHSGEPLLLLLLL